MSDLEKLRAEMLQDPEFREYYNERKIYADIARAIMAGRLNKGLTQKELAKLTGNSQANISRYENGEKDLTVNTLKRIAQALDLEVKIEFVPISKEAPSEE